MLRVKNNDTVPRMRRRMNGDVYPPVDTRSLLLTVARNEVKIKLKFMMLKLVGKYFCP